MAIKLQFIKKLNISSASGLIRVVDKFYAVADDELSLISFTEKAGGAINVFKLFPGELPADAEERKKIKPDLESLVYLTEINSILAVPSGSKSNRCIGALAGLSDNLVQSVQPIDFSNLFSALQRQIADLNIEGVLSNGAEIKLFQRGNGKSARNAVISLKHNIFMQELKSGCVSENCLIDVKTCDLGLLNGVPLAFTDAVYDESAQQIVFLAAAEKTESTYDDGEYAGAVIGYLNDKNEVICFDELLCDHKPEGLWVQGDIFFVVTDADSPDVASELYQGFIFPLRNCASTVQV